MASMSGPGHISPVCAIGEEDEFMTYYKQFRPEYGSDTTNLMGTSLRFRPLIRGISTYEPWEEKTNSFSNSKPMSAGRKIPWYQSLKRKWKRKSKSMEERSMPCQSQRTPITRQANSQICSYPSSSSASPIGGLSTMLPDKMTMSTSSHSQGDETQSRDSGHSSGGGSPDLRGLRLRGRASAVENDWHDATLMPYRGYQARSTDYNWYLRRSPDRNYEAMRIESDAKSICSHGSHSGSYMVPTTSSNGTQTSGSGPFLEGVECEASNSFSERSDSACKCRGGSRYPLPVVMGSESRLEFWCPGTESATSERVISPSHPNEAGVLPFNSIVRNKGSDHKHSGNALPLSTWITKWCLRLWLLIKIVMAGTFSCFVLFVFLFYHSWPCGNDKMRSRSQDRFSADPVVDSENV